jgi:hypothetical protein
VDVQTAAGKMKQGSAGQRKDAHQLHHRKTAAGLLAGGLRISALVLGRVGHGEIGAIGNLDVTPPPAALGGDVAFQPIGQLFMNAQQGLIRQSCTGLTIGALSQARCPPGGAVPTRPVPSGPPHGRPSEARAPGREKPRRSAKG